MKAETSNAGPRSRTRLPCRVLPVHVGQVTQVSEKRRLVALDKAETAAERDMSNPAQASVMY